MRRKQVIKYIFHNPNSKEETIELLTDLYAEILLEKALRLKAEKSKDYK